MEIIYIDILGFFFCTLIIFYGGNRLSYYGDQIAEITKMGKAWIGLFIMASITSLPELVSGISSVAIINAPDLAAGDLLGSCIFNMLILSVLDWQVKRPLFSMVKSGHIVAVIGTIIIIALTGISIYLGNEIPAFFWISSFTPIIFLVYIITIWLIFKHQKNSINERKNKKVIPVFNKNANLKKVLGYFSANVLIVFGASLLLPYFGEQIAKSAGLGNSFFGTLFMAASTSLPELAVSLSSIKLKAIDMAVGNLLGSNLFNVFLLGFDDLFYKKGSLFANINPSNLLTIFIIIIMSVIVCLGILFKPKKKQLVKLGLDTFVLIILYISLMIYLFIHN